jgi:prepilin peptidase CpaA
MLGFLSSQLDFGDSKIAALQWAVVIGASVFGAVSDVRTRTIPNALTGCVLVTGLIWAYLTVGFTGLAESAGTCVLLALPYLFLFIFCKGGAGDAKLMGAIGAWLGLSQGLIVLVCVAAAGIVLAVIKAIAQKRLISVLSFVLTYFYGILISLLTRRKLVDNLVADNRGEQAATVGAERRLSCGQSVPYGIAILAGVFTAGILVWL